jgi:hypothetical protein
MALPRVRLTIRTEMTIIAVTAGLLAIATSCPLILLLVLPVVPFVVLWRAPSTEFVCTLIGMAFGALVITPADVNYRPTFDLRDFADLLWIIGGTVAGALVGVIVARADRRIVRKREPPSPAP